MKKSSEQFRVWLEKLKSAKHSYQKKGIRPTRDWNIMLVTSFVISLFVAIYAVFFYYQINNISIFQVERVEDQSATGINRPLLDAVVKDIDYRTMKFVELDSGNVVKIDPGV